MNQNQETNQLNKKLQFHCFKCETIYQLSEVHSQSKPNCSDNCLQKWQELCHEYYQEKVLSYIAQAEEQKEKDLEKQETPDWLKK